jgi:hypothetical protein
VHSVVSIAVFAAGQSALGLLAFVAVALALIMSLVFLLARPGNSAYDQIGQGGIARESDYGAGAPASEPASPAARAEREQEIRQLLRARSERLVRSGQPALDVDAELARLLAGEQPPRTRDAGLVSEVRQLVIARNERRVRQGLEPLDVDGEVARTLAELDA